MRFAIDRQQSEMVLMMPVAIWSQRTDKIDNSLKAPEHHLIVGEILKYYQEKR